MKKKGTSVLHNQSFKIPSIQPKVLYKKYIITANFSFTIASTPTHITMKELGTKYECGAQCSIVDVVRWVNRLMIDTCSLIK